MKTIRRALVVSPKTNLWHCLGACNVGGSTIDWVMKTRGVSFRHAVELLRADHPSLAAGDGLVVRKGTTVKLEVAHCRGCRRPADLTRCRELLSRHAEAIARSSALSRSSRPHASGDGRPLQLGFANRKLGLSLPDKNRKAGAELRGRLQRLGVLRESRDMSTSTGRWCFRSSRSMAKCSACMAARSRRTCAKALPLHLYLPGPHRGVWNEEALVARKRSFFANR